MILTKIFNKNKNKQDVKVNEDEFSNNYHKKIVELMYENNKLRMKLEKTTYERDSMKRDLIRFENENIKLRFKLEVQNEERT